MYPSFRVKGRTHFFPQNKTSPKIKGPEGSIYYGAFLVTVTSILTFLQFSQKCARLYRPFRQFRLL